MLRPPRPPHKIPPPPQDRLTLRSKRDLCLLPCTFQLLLLFLSLPLQCRTSSKFPPRLLRKPHSSSPQNPLCSTPKARNQRLASLTRRSKKKGEKGGPWTSSSPFRACPFPTPLPLPFLLPPSSFFLLLSHPAVRHSSELFSYYLGVGYIRSTLSFVFPLSRHPLQHPCSSPPAALPAAAAVSPFSFSSPSSCSLKEWMGAIVCGDSCSAITHPSW